MIAKLEWTQSKLQLNKDSSFNTDALLLRLVHIVILKTSDKRDDFNLKYFIFLFLIEMTRSPSYGVYILQLNHFGRVCSNPGDFNRVISKLFKLGYQYYIFRKAFFLKFYDRHSELIVKYTTSLKHFCSKAYQNLYFMLFYFINLKELFKSKKDGKDQEMIQSSTSPDPGYHMGK